jgi:hypothetical protein
MTKLRAAQPTDHDDVNEKMNEEAPHPALSFRDSLLIWKLEASVAFLP